MTIHTSDSVFILAVWVGEYDHLSSSLSFNLKRAPFSGVAVLPLVVYAFSCGLWNCVVLNNGTIFASSSSSTGLAIYHDANIAATDAFAFDPRCSSGINLNSSVFTVRSAWMGDGEVILHWGGGCYTALEIVVDGAVPRVVISWAACVGTDIPRAPGATHAYLGSGTFAVVSAVFKGSLACVEDDTPVPKNLMAGSFSSRCNGSASGSVNFFDIAVDMYYGELFLRDNEFLNSMNSSVFTLALFKVPWRQQFSGSVRHISDSNISLIPNMIQTSPMCQITGVIATTGLFLISRFVSEPFRFDIHQSQFVIRLMLECIVKNFFFELGNFGLVGTCHPQAAVVFFSLTGWPWNTTLFIVDAAILTCKSETVLFIF